MKRIALYFGMAVVLLASCSIQEMDFQTPLQEDVEFYASFEQPTEEETKVYANEDLLLRWTADDRVSIFNKKTYNQQYAFTGETGDNAGGFKKVESDEFMTGNDISHVVSVYPYQEATKISESEVITVTLPAEQHYAQNTFGLGANTMVSVTEDNFLQYKNVGGYLRITLYGQGAVSSITLKGNNGEKLAGNATVTMPMDGVPSVQMASDATDMITLICDNYVGLNSDSEKGTDFWFVVPPVTFSKGFTVTVNTLSNWGVKNEKSTSKSLTIERSKLSKMSPFEVIYQPRNVIYYTSTDSKVVIPYSPNGFGGANIISNVFYEDGYYGALTFDQDLTSIGAYAFNNCTNLSIIYIPDGVASIGYGAFNNCTELFGVNMSVKCPLTRIESATFQGCKNLSGMTIPFSVTSIGDFAFNQCSNLFNIWIPDGVTSIGGGAFNQCSRLPKVTLPASLTSIGGSAFNECSSLTELSIPAGVTDIGSAAFMNCNQLTKITVLSDTPPTGNEWMFYGTNECPIFVPAGSVDAYKSASAWSEYAHRIQAPRPTYIRYTSSDGQIVEPRNPQNFGANIVSNVYKNGQGVITLDGLVTVFGGAVFAECPTLTSIQIPESVVRIENLAFVNCASLESISLPEGLTFLGGSAFASCSSLNTISIPNSVTTVESGAFQNCSSLESVTLPEGLTVIRPSVFGGCSSLKSVTIPPRVERIESGAFSDCTSLSSVSIPSSVTYMTWSSFGNCVSLTSVTIPENVSEMNSAFWGCTGLKSATVLPYYPPYQAFGVFGNEEDGSLSEDLIIYVPKGRADAYKAAGAWKQYADRIFEIGTPMAVDMGLSVKWASFNLGASKPEEYGDYYAWGETEPYYSSLDPLVWKGGKEAGYAWSSYKWCMGDEYTMTKYCSSSDFGFNGFTDTKTVLDPEDDVAHVNLGGNWRMPTDSEWTELMENCTWTWTTQNGVNGRLVTSGNGNSIFLPAAGYRSDTSLDSVGSYGRYWSSSLSTGMPRYAWGLYFYYGYSDLVFRSDDYRLLGHSIRPVYAE